MLVFFLGKDYYNGRINNEKFIEGKMLRTDNGKLSPNSPIWLWLCIKMQETKLCEMRDEWCPDLAIGK